MFVTDKPVEISITIPYTKRKVIIMIDNEAVKTTISTSTGQVQLMLDSEDCKGERLITIHSLDYNHTISKKPLVSKRVIFEAS
jgi:hypothetical protein